jgi:hypothetical protein
MAAATSGILQADKDRERFIFTTAKLPIFIRGSTSPFHHLRETRWQVHQIIRTGTDT